MQIVIYKWLKCFNKVTDEVVKIYVFLLKCLRVEWKIHLFRLLDFIFGPLVQWPLPFCCLFLIIENACTKLLYKSNNNKKWWFCNKSDKSDTSRMSQQQTVVERHIDRVQYIFRIWISKHFFWIGVYFCEYSNLANLDCAMCFE